MSKIVIDKHQAEIVLNRNADNEYHSVASSSIAGVLSVNYLNNPTAINLICFGVATILALGVAKYNQYKLNKNLFTRSLNESAKEHSGIVQHFNQDQKSEARIQSLDIPINLSSAVAGAQLFGSLSNPDLKKMFCLLLAISACSAMSIIKRSKLKSLVQQYD